MPGTRRAGIAHTPSGLPVSVPFQVAKDRRRDRRNGFTIHGYTGANGGGKTLAAVYDSLPALAAGRPVVSTCRILDPVTGEPHPLWVPLDDYRVFFEPGFGFCDVILDEVTGVASSRDSQSLPSAVLNHLMQLRKDDTTIRWTTPNWKRADTGIREVTQGLTTCRGLVRSNQVVVTDDGLVRRWQQRKGFIWRTYDAQNFDEWSTTKEKSPSRQYRLRPEVRQVLWAPGLLVRECYDTYEHALTLGVVSEGGVCMDCGGSRPRKRCVCGTVDKTTGEVVQIVRDETYGMRRWRQVDTARRRGRSPQDFPSGATPADPQTEDFPAGPVLFPETDDTPAVVVEPASV